MDHDRLVQIAIQYPVLLFALSFHESAHAWSALRFGDTTARDLGRISLNPLRHIDPIGTVFLPLMGMLGGGAFMIGWAKPTPVNLSRTSNPRKANLLVSAAGPLSNLLLCAVGFLALIALRHVPGAEGGTVEVLAPLFQIMLAFTLVNFGLGIFNLLPIPPLDGSHVLASLVGGKTAEILERSNPLLGFGILILLLYTGVLRALMQPLWVPFQALLFRVLS